MSKKIVCKNEDDVQIEFSYEEDAEFFLVSCDGIYSVSNNVVTSENTMTDGSTYQGSTTKQRNIVITAEFDSDYQSRRDFLYKSFKAKSPGTFSIMKMRNNGRSTIMSKTSTSTGKAYAGTWSFPCYARIRFSRIQPTRRSQWRVGNRVSSLSMSSRTN